MQKYNIVFLLCGLLIVFFISCEKDIDSLSQTVDFDMVWKDSTYPALISFINHSDASENYFWEFGDGSVSYDFSPVHYYESKGNYKVTLISLNNNLESQKEKVLLLPEIFIFVLSNKSPFNLYDVTFYNANDSFPVIKHCGNLECHTSTLPLYTLADKIYVCFKNPEGICFRSAFPFSLSGDEENKFIIDRYTLVIVNNQ